VKQANGKFAPTTLALCCLLKRQTEAVLTTDTAEHFLYENQQHSTQATLGERYDWT
jgi:hypothetical protein